jgi:CrcB protein
MKPLLIIGLGGGLGSIFRYLLQIYAGKTLPMAFPIGTFLVNIIGCFLIGLFFGLSNKYLWLSLEWRLFLITGLCGGFTTFSTFSYESVGLFRQGNYPVLLLYIFTSILAGFLATLGGSALIR